MHVKHSHVMNGEYKIDVIVLGMVPRRLDIHHTTVTTTYNHPTHCASLRSYLIRPPGYAGYIYTRRPYKQLAMGFTI